MPLGIEFNYYKRLIEIFDLDETYLPEIPFQRESTRIVETYPDSNLGDKGLWKNIFLKIKYFFYEIKNFFKSVDIEENKNLFDFQYRVKKILKSIKNNKKRMIVHMPTGSGKTRTTISSLIDLMISNNDYTQYG